MRFYLISSHYRANFNFSEDEFSCLLVARFNMVPELIRMIRRETEHVKADRKGRIVLKMNGLHDRRMIDELYRAGSAGVEIDLLVRGICCLVPDQPYSPNIRMTQAALRERGCGGCRYS